MNIAEQWRKALEPPLTEEQFRYGIMYLEHYFKTSREAIFEIMRREGVENLIDYLLAHSDEELQELFERYTNSSLVEQHYLMQWFGEIVRKLIPGILPGDTDLLYREVLRWAERERGILNEGEFIKVLRFEPWFQEDVQSYLVGISYFEEMKRYYEKYDEKLTKLMELRDRE